MMFGLTLVLALSLSAQTVREVIPTTAQPAARVLVAGSELAGSGITVTFSGPGGTRVTAPVHVRESHFIEVSVPPDAFSGTVTVSNGATTVRTLPFTVLPDSGWQAITTIFGGRSGRGLLHQPQGVAVDPTTGTLFVTDTRNHQIKVLAPDGTVRVLAGSGNPGFTDGIGAAAELKEPSGLAFDPSRKVLYVADAGNHCIRIITLAGGVTTLAGTGQPGDDDGPGVTARFKRPVGLAVDADGSVFVADTNNHKIRRVTANGIVSTVAGTGRDGYLDGPAAAARFAAPEAVAIGRSGALYIADTGNHRIRKVEDGIVTLVAGDGRDGFDDGPVEGAHFDRPAGLATGEGDMLFVADSGNGLIRAVVSGVVSTIAGRMDGPQNDPADGAPLQANLRQPAGLAFAGALYIADTNNDAVRMLRPEFRVADVYPRRGPVAGGNEIRVFGVGFVPALTEVAIGTKPAAVTFVTSTLLLVTVPASAAGDADVSVSCFGETRTLSGRYRYLAPPTLTSIVPNEGKASGDESVTVRGTELMADETEILFGGARATDVVINDPTSASVTTPPGSHGSVDVLARTPGGEARFDQAFRYFAAPLLTTFTPPSGFPGTVVTIEGQYFDPETAGNVIRFGSIGAPTLAASETSLSTRVPEQAVTAPISVTTAGGTTTTSTTFVVPVLSAITVTPATATIEPTGTAQFTALGTFSNGNTSDLTTTVVWTSTNNGVATVDAGGLARGVSGGNVTIEAEVGDIRGTAKLTVTSPEPLPPDPSSLAPATDRTIAQSFADTTRFLYTGPNAIQTGVAAGTIEPYRAAVVRGRVTTREGEPLGGAKVTIAGRPELGETLSRADGMYDLAVNGGGRLTVRVEKNGYLPIERQPHVQWNDFTLLADVALTPLDSEVTPLSLGASVLQWARGSRVSDADGARQATLLMPAETTATLLFPDGSTRPLTTISVRATEYTVGSGGLNAMPAELPPTTAYTYCVELSADEAIAAGATEVRFSKPLAIYVENFLGFPVGEVVPAGYYDRATRSWVPSTNGRVIRITSIAGGLAAIDLNGDTAPDDAETLALLGIDDAERQRLASLYASGQTLWRVPVTHFTPWDYNWPYAPLPGAVPPTLNGSSISVTPPTTAPALDDPLKRCGSIIECENRGLGETAAVSGTPWALHYRSTRTEGQLAAYTIDINLTGKALPPGIKSVEMEISIAGTRLEASFAPSPDLHYIYQWNGRNAYGQSSEGGTPATIRVGYTYPLFYTSSPYEFLEAFAQVGDAPATLGTGRRDVTFWQTLNIDGIRESLPTPWTNKATALGGWSFSPHHAYDQRFHTLYLGTGEQRSAQPVVSPFAGTYQMYGFDGDGGAATKAILNEPEGVAVGPDGTVYIADSINAVVRKVSPSGTITTYAGTPGKRSTFGGPIVGDGGPATSALFQYPWDLEVGPDGTLYIVDFATIRKVSPDGIISTVAGTNQWSDLGEGDRGSATKAKISPRGMSLGPDGTLYFMDGYGIRKVVNGIITTVYRGRNSTFYQHTGFDVACGPDGSVYFAAQRSTRDIVRLAPSGIVSTFVSKVEVPFGMAMGRDGSVYYSRRSGRYVYRAGPDGTHSLVAGTALYENRGDYGPPTAAPLGTRYLGRVAVGPDGALYVADGSNSLIRKIEPSLPGGLFADGQRVVSTDGNEVYLFDRDGRHLATVGRNGEPRLTFGYDSDGQLTSITDANGNATKIVRNDDGEPTAIVAPGGQETRLSLNANGYLARISNPAGEASVYQYSGKGLLLSYLDPREFEHTYTYNDAGSLVTDAAPDGASMTLAQSQSGKTVTTTMTTAEGRQETTSILRSQDGSERRPTVSPSSNTAQYLKDTDGTITVIGPGGTVLTTRHEPDPRYGMHAPAIAEETIRTPSGLLWDMTASRTAILEDSTRPFTLQSETSVWTINGRKHVSTYDIAMRRMTLQTPAGRMSSTTFDADGRPTRIGVPGASEVVISYESGLVRSISAGSRTSSFTYNARNELTAVQDVLGRRVEFTYDSAGRVLTRLLSDKRLVRFSYDRGGNLTSVTPPGRPAHGFTYTAGNQTASYIAPGGVVTQYLYNRDRQLATIKRPDGQSVSLTYDGGGRLAAISAPSVNYTYEYAAGDRVRSAVHGEQQLSFTHDGPLVTSGTWSGTIAGAISWRWNNDFWLTEETVAGSSAAFGYDADGLLTSAGALTLTREPTSGMITGSILGHVTDRWTYDAMFEVMGYTGAYDDMSLLSLTYSRDGAGRITAVDGREFEYDAAGRLVRVTERGNAVAEYDYDANGNRTAHRYVGGSATATYDEQDRLLTYGGVDYSYTAAGDLKSKTVGGATTTFDYDAFGNLRKVTFPGGRTIEYVIDAYNRRIGKKVDGALVHGWIFADRLRVVAELDASNNLVSRFIYGTRNNVPDYMVKNGVTYRILADHLGSPRIVVNVNDGSIVQSLTYDEFGRVLSDTNPGFQPFGFAGGLHDNDTNLVRFGARDYDPHTGRWTTKEPLGFAGADTNFYAYAFNDPINLVDIDGMKTYPANFIGPLQPGDTIILAVDLNDPRVAPLLAPKYGIAPNFYYPPGTPQNLRQECVSLTKALTGAQCHTSCWRAGPRVIGNNIPSGTAIATFDDSGRYPGPNVKDKNSGIFLYQYPDRSLVLIDQYPVPLHLPQARPIDPSPGRSNNSEAYSVITVLAGCGCGF